MFEQESIGTCLFKGIGQNGEPGRVQVACRQDAVVVGGLGKLDDKLLRLMPAATAELLLLPLLVTLAGAAAALA